MAKLKLNRTYTFKAYVIENDNANLISKTMHCGEFIYKSECHYYVEKNILDILNNNRASEDIKNKIYLIYKVSTLEDSNIEDLLVEQINFDGEKINII